MEKNGGAYYTLSHVALHNSKHDCWLTINGKIVNVTKFMEEHPGGEEVLIEYGGKDATKAFEDIGHSKAAHNLLLKFQVGYLQGYKEIDENNSYHDEMPKAKQMEAFVIKDEPEPKSTFIDLFVPLLVAGLYFGYCCMTEATQFGS